MRQLLVYETCNQAQPIPIDKTILKQYQVKVNMEKKFKDPVCFASEAIPTSKQRFERMLSDFRDVIKDLKEIEANMSKLELGPIEGQE